MKYRYYIVNGVEQYLQAVMDGDDIEYNVGKIEDAIEFGDFNSAYEWLNNVKKRYPDQDWKIDVVD